MKPDLYWYRARLTTKKGVRQYDADTVRLDVDLGFDNWLVNVSVRLARINAYEVRGPEKALGKEARAYMLGILRDREFCIQTRQLKGRLRGKFGRFLADVWIENDGWRCVNDLLVEAGHARYTNY